MVEQRIRNAWVGGSTPLFGTRFSKVRTVFYWQLQTLSQEIKSIDPFDPNTNSIYLRRGLCRLVQQTFARARDAEVIFGYTQVMSLELITPLMPVIVMRLTLLGEIYPI